MKFKVAVGTEDGLNLDVHFGKCTRFKVFAVDTDISEYSEEAVRTVDNVCKQCGHSDHDFGALADALADCKVILINRVGYPARAFMESRGFAVLPDDGGIDDAVKRLIGRMRDKNN
ncbi:MAG: hypothetical protein LBT55_07650 [Clostridiaceae bacterium]|jgi:predicted Fe-Mo cluster-binding NifX family protein|nr:hypothetical protein [Clostridiaceae bacterium]